MEPSSSYTKKDLIFVELSEEELTDLIWDSIKENAGMYNMTVKSADQFVAEIVAKAKERRLISED